MAIIQTRHDYDNFLYKLGSHHQIVIDTETTGLRAYHGDRIFGISVYFPSDDTVYYLPFRHDQTRLEGSKWQGFYTVNLPHAWLQEFRINPCAEVITFNGKFDLHMLAADGIELASTNKFLDVMIAAHIANENEELSHGSRVGAYKLKRLAKKYLGDASIEAEDRLDQIARALGLSAKTEMVYMPMAVTASYAEKDVEITWKLHEFYLPVLKRWGQTELYYSHSEFTHKALFRMERNGIYHDIMLAGEHIAGIEPQKKALLAWFYKTLGDSSFNPNSNPQVLAAFDRLYGVKLRSASKDTLLILERKGYELATKLLEWRKINKATSSFYSPYSEFVDSDGFIHPSFNPTGTVTGRLSSSEPNFQQIPREDKSQFKQTFRARPGYVFVQADYAQLELRLATHFAREATMMRLFLEGEDMHQYTADRLTEALGRFVDRQDAKTYNFSNLYGMGAKKAKIKYRLDSEKAASQILEGWHGVYPGFRRAMYSAADQASILRDETGKPGKFQYIRLRNGRTRKYHEYRRYGLKDQTYTAWNFIVQGTAAIIVEESILNIVKRFDNNEEVKPNATIHDSVIFEIKTELVPEYVPEIRKILLDWDEYSPPMDVDIKVGVTWGDMEKYETWAKTRTL